MVRLGTIAGIEVRAHSSALLVFGGIAAAFAFIYLPGETPDATLPERLAVGLIVALLLAGSVASHEFAHAIVARSRGKSVDGLTLYLFGGSANIDDRGISASDEIAIGIAGPIASAVLACIFTVAGIALWKSSKPAGELVLLVGFANGLLAVFNALPGFPMDGGRVLRGILWRASGNAVSATKHASSAGRVIAYIIVALGPLLILQNYISAGIWVAATGWLLATLAQSYYRAMLMKIALDGLLVQDLCARDLPALQTSDTIAAAGARFGGGALSRTLPVLFGERIAGVISDVQAAGVAPAQAQTTTVASVMTRAFELPSLEPDVDASILPSLLSTAPLGAAIVEFEGSFIGIVRREDINRYVEMVEDLGNSVAAQRGLRALARRHMESGVGSGITSTNPR
jgi:Zn-dependent protease/predicted transcriptional regulator